MTFNNDAVGGVLVQPRSLIVQGVACFGRQAALVGIEENAITDGDDELLFRTGNRARPARTGICCGITVAVASTGAVDSWIIGRTGRDEQHGSKERKQAGTHIQGFLMSRS